MSLDVLRAGETAWIVARSTGVASLVALTLSLLTGMAMRPKSLAWLSTNRAISELHSYATALWLPLGAALFCTCVAANALIDASDVSVAAVATARRRTAERMSGERDGMRTRTARRGRRYMRLA